MSELFHAADRSAVEDAASLMTTFGEHALAEALQRADRSRDGGNAIRFCHWRQIARLILILGDEEPVGTRH